MARSSGQPKTTAKKVAEFSTLNPLLTAMHTEFQEFSRKKPDGQVGPTKVRMVNRLLKAVHQLLDGEPNREYLDELNEDDLPQNSDVVLILSQTVAAMNAYHSKYSWWNGVEQAWFT
ncbi:hypothetical protein [Bradyrhizobium sp. CCBAU 45389]|uniref:hypothetical protein n=1 Tax=Bradyrhizobium sp. CCBAU 45389 TaxID=858429 RepID=UPI002306C3EB|nr:hypothetical protein [Bradyrhizobium sp. CCBAU 45389]MDA9401498.1 hypothetical protein [Bradyrhizobium sp. CCBAU 45389]